MKHEVITPQREWTARSEHWLAQSIASKSPRGLRERQSSPLVLCGDGVHLRIEKGTLHIRGGLTHYPQERETYRFFRGDLDLPSRIVAVDCSGGLSFDVLAWLAEQEVGLVCVDWKGEGVSVLSCNGYSADPKKVAWQQETRHDEAARLAFAADLIRRKIVASITTLEDHIAPSRLRTIALEKARVGIERLEKEQISDLNDIFAIEGECASSYFGAWRGLPIAWKATKQYPIPEAWLKYGGRSSLATGVKAENRNASHPINAMLNYAYGVKLVQMQIDAVAEGYDPTLGVMHNRKRGKERFVLDLIEPERPKIDAVVLKLIVDHPLSGADFTIRYNGGCRLSPQLARHLTTLLGR